jgi:hypothetical protein
MGADSGMIEKRLGDRRRSTVHQHCGIVLAAIILCGLWSGAAEAAGENPICTQAQVEDKLRCFQDRLEAVIKTEGTEQALSLLEALTKQDADAEREAHPLVHHIGQRSFAYYGEAAKAMSHCRDVFWSGCYHGVLQAYLGSLPVVESHHIVSLCPPVAGSDFSFKRYNCLHGLGHGVTLQFHYDLLKSLAYCDFLTNEWDRESCYGGVFMENIVTFQTARQAQHSQHDHHAHQPATSFMNAQDLLYPCSALDNKYLRSCYLMQTSAILTFLNYDFGQAFAQCERVAGEHQTTCYRSLGRDISGYTLRDSERVTQLCGLGRGD